MEIFRLSALSDNYIFLLYDSASQTAAVVDPAQPEPVLRQLRRLGASLVSILNTHHHADHVGGNRQLLQAFPHAVIYGGTMDKGRIPGQQVYLSDGDTVTFAGRQATIYFVPGHTKAHIAYYFPPVEDSGWGELFCGDTLFAGGCGRLFEGTPQQMVSSLGKLRSLPDTTHIWCGHEYTLNNLRFALTVDGDNPDLQARLEQVQTARRHNQATVPSELGLEKRTNPFLRWDQPALQTAANIADPVSTFARLRGLKDRF